MEALTVMLLTAATKPERAEYAYRTLHSTLDNLRTSHPLYVHIADDGSTPEHREVCCAIAGGYAHVQGVSATNSERGGYGRNFNLATQAVHNRGGFVLPLEDDWELREPLDVDPLLAILGGTIHCIRLGYLGATQELRATFVGIEGVGNLWMLDPASPERHVFAGHPRLETVEFERRCGEWPVDVDPGMTEFIVAGRPEARVGVAWREAGPHFVHCGAVQARTDQE